jgi:hypothetical protein
MQPPLRHVLELCGSKETEEEMGVRAGVVMMGVLGLLPIGGPLLWLVAVASLAVLIVGLLIAEAVSSRSPA